MGKLLDKYKQEEQYYKLLNKSNKRTENSIKYIQKFVEIVEQDNPDLTRTGFADVLSGVTTLNNRGVFSPLSLKEGEFIYKEKGLSINRRREDIKMDTTGIFYENAYTISIDNAITVKDNRLVDVDEHLKYSFITNDNRIYIAFGNKLSSYYFTKAYLFESTVKRAYYYPASPIHIKVNVLLADIDKLLFVFWDDFYVKKLREYYSLYPIKDIENIPTLIKFNIDINLDYAFNKNQRGTF